MIRSVLSGCLLWMATQSGVAEVPAELSEEGHCVGAAASVCNQTGEELLHRDLDQALLYFEAACAGGSNLGCANLRVRNHHERGNKLQAGEAVSRFLSNCERGQMNSCAHLAFRYQAGDGVEQNYQLAAKYYRLACAKRFARACSYLGVLSEHGLGVPQSLETARQLYHQGCEGGNKTGCRFLENMP